MTALGTGSAVPLAGRCAGARHQPTGRDPRLAPGDAGAIRAGVAPHQGQAGADAWDRAQAGARLGVGRWGRGAALPLALGEAAVVGAEQRAVACDALVGAGAENRLATPPRFALSASFVPSCGRGYGLVVLWMWASRPVRWRRRCRRRRSRSRLARLSAGATYAWGSRPPRCSPALLWASIRSCWAWPPWLAFRSRACPRTQGLPSWAQRAARQGPGAAAVDADPHVLPVGRHGLEDWSRGGVPLAVEQDLAVLRQDAAGQAAGVQVDTPGNVVLLAGEWPAVASFAHGCWPNASSPTGVC